MTGVTRRSVLAGASAGAGLVIWSSVDSIGCAATMSNATQPNLWLRIAANGDVVVRTISCDMGQGAQTGIAQLMCEELDADWSKISVEMAPVEPAFFVRDDGYYTGGSQSITRSFDTVRQVAATARQMLIEAAAKRWRVEPSACTTETGYVMHAASGRASYGELAEEASRMPPPKNVALKPRERWRVIGQPKKRFDLPGKVDGSTIYGVDVSVPGLLVATIAQCPVIGGKLKRVDTAPAMRIAGVRRVISFDDAVVVVADSFWTARRGLESLKPEWDLGPNAEVDTELMMRRLRDNVAASDAEIYVPEGGDGAALRKRSEDAFRNAARLIEATYEAPLLAHAPLEPMNATARVDQSACDIWLPTQAQGDTRSEVAKAIGVEPERVRVHTTAIGGGFGRRLRVDYAVYAARAAKAMGGPVKLIWTREEDTQQGFYRPASVVRLRCAVSANGAISALETFGATNNDTAFGGLALVPYAIPSVIAGQKKVESHIRYGAWRSVDRSQNVFFLESFLDEIAVAVGKDPLTLRKELLAASPRRLRVLEAVAEMSGWGKKKAKGHLGIAFMSGWGTNVAQVADVTVDADKRLRVNRVHCAFDCGTAVNPDAVRAQIEGGIIMGLSAALGEQITIREGRVEQGLFDSYPLLRMGQAPDIEIRLLESPSESLGGVGEPPLPLVAPALANAIFAATGKRLRSLPIVRHGFVVS